jgi:hypothetical protein
MGIALTELGKHLGRLQVEVTPDWGSLTSELFAAWVHATTQGWRSSYGHL